MDFLGIIVAGLVVLLFARVWEIINIVLWRPYALTKHFRKQGVHGPPHSLLSGSLDEMKNLKMVASETVLDTRSNDITQRVLPHYHKWCPEYGETILFWYGTKARVSITDPELAKQILSNKFGCITKIKSRPMVIRLVGKGLVVIDGQKWATHRSIINPAFSMDKLKDMVKLMATCTKSIIGEWKQRASEAKDNTVKLEMNSEFQKITADVISRTAFGSSYIQGREAFRAQKELQKYSASANISVFLPGSQYLPTPSNIQAWKLDRKVKSKIKQIIKSRMNSHAANSDPASYGDDLLGLIIGASDHGESNSPKLSMDEIMEECKTFFFAGHETTSSLLTWTAFLLSLHKDWQEKLREEVLRVCGMEIPDADMLSKLKLVNMVLLEVLRLYSPAIELNREVLQDIKVGNLMVPKNTCLTIPIMKIHRSKEYWGEDANEFNPFRFKDGTTKAATHPNAFLGFGMGPRVCIGQNFAMLEAKTVLTLILQRFSLTLSSEYKHAPINYITLQPQHGLPIIIKSLDT